MRYSGQKMALAALCAAMLAACGGNGADTPGAKLLAGGATAAANQPVVSAYYDLVQYIYIAYLGRPADPAGQDFWAQTFQQFGFPATPQGLLQASGSNPQINQVLQSFANAAEARELYAGTNAEIINSIYVNLLNRYAEDAGRAYWGKQLDAKLISAPAIALSIMAGAQGDDQLVISKKARVAANFTAGLQAAAANGYAPDTRAAPIGAELLEKVTKDTDLTVFQTEIDRAVALTSATYSLTRLHYSGFQHRQDVDKGSPYTVLYRSAMGDFSPYSATYKFGLSERTVRVSRSDAKPPQFLYDSAITASVQLPAPIEGLLTVPTILMLCQASSEAIGWRGVATDVLVSHSAQMITDAKDLANQAIATYRSDCATIEQGAIAPAMASFVFDNQGNVTLKSASGGADTVYSAAQFSSLLQGQASYDQLTRLYTVIRAYSYSTLGGLRYALLVHSAPQLSGNATGRLGIWAQE